MKKTISRLIATLSAVALILFCGATIATPVTKSPAKNFVGKYVFKRTPHVGDVVYPSAYTGGYCSWQDGDGQPWPVNPYSRSQDWVGQACKVVAVYQYCVLLTPVWPLVPGNYYINWDINHV